MLLQKDHFFVGCFVSFPGHFQSKPSGPHSNLAIVKSGILVVLYHISQSELL